MNRSPILCSCGTPWAIRKTIPTHGKPVIGYWCPRCDTKNRK